MKREFKIGIIQNNQDFYNFGGTLKMTVSEGINMCKNLFKDNDLTNVCLGYDWGSEINIIFEIGKDNINGILETEAQLMIKEEFKLK
tara:strand:+ start:419 stop:679 length:261 start_codon:yes stop_codon:yes gene_type:complete